MEPGPADRGPREQHALIIPAHGSMEQQHRRSLTPDSTLDSPSPSLDHHGTQLGRGSFFFRRFHGLLR